MREKLLRALRDTAGRVEAPLTTGAVAAAAGVDEETVLRHLGPAENYAALLSYQQPVAAPAAPQDTRERILESAARVFGRKGFQRATLDEVASDAGMTKGAIYWHFKSKNDLFFALLDHNFQQHTGPLMSEVENAVRRAEQGDAEGGLREMFRSGLRRCTEDANWPQLYVECVAHTRDPEVRARFMEVYQKVWAMSAELTKTFQAKGLSNEENDPEVAAIFWTALFDGLILAWLIHQDRMDLDVLAEKIFRLIWRGVAPASARTTGE